MKKHLLLFALLAALLAWPSFAADKKISDLDDGGDAQATDMIPAVRGGANYRIAIGANLGTLSSAFSKASSSGPASLQFGEDTDNGSNKVTLKAPASISSDADIILPATGTLATLAGTETLTNKTLDGYSNTGNHIEVFGAGEFISYTFSDGSLLTFFAQGGGSGGWRWTHGLEQIEWDEGDGLVATTEANFSEGYYFGGTTSSFPFLKRNGAEVDFRLGDDSGYANVNLGSVDTGTWNGTAVAVSKGGTGGTTVRDAAAGLNSCYVLAQSAVAASNTATTSEEALATVTVPASAMGANGRIEVEAAFAYTNGADDKIMRIRFNGISGTVYRTFTDTTTASRLMKATIMNRNSASSQAGFISNTNTNHYGSSVNAITTSAVNTGSAVDIVISGQKETSGDTLTLEAYKIELCPKS